MAGMLPQSDRRVVVVCLTVKKKRLLCASHQTNILVTGIILLLVVEIAFTQAQTPTIVPSEWPTLVPTRSVHPTVSAQPSIEPTVSSAPTSSYMPSNAATLHPQSTDQPTFTIEHQPSISNQGYYTEKPSTGEPSWIPKSSGAPSTTALISPSPLPSGVPSLSTRPSTYTTQSPSLKSAFSTLSPASVRPSSVPSLSLATRPTLSFTSSQSLASELPTTWGANLLLPGPTKSPILQTTALPSIEPTRSLSTVGKDPAQSATPTSNWQQTPTISSTFQPSAYPASSVRSPSTDPRRTFSPIPTDSPQTAPTQWIANVSPPPSWLTTLQPSVHGPFPSQPSRSPSILTVAASPWPSTHHETDQPLSATPTSLSSGSVPTLLPTSTPSISTRIAEIPTAEPSFAQAVAAVSTSPSFHPARNPAAIAETSSPSVKFKSLTLITGSPSTNPITNHATTSMPSLLNPSVTETNNPSLAPSSNQLVTSSNKPSKGQTANLANGPAPPDFPTILPGTNVASSVIPSWYPNVSPSVVPMLRPSLDTRGGPTLSPSTDPSPVQGRPADLQLTTFTPTSADTGKSLVLPSATPSLSSQPSTSATPSVIPSPLYQFSKVALQFQGTKFIARLGLFNTQQRNLQDSTDICQKWGEYVAERIRKEVILILPLVEAVRVELLNATYDKQVKLRTIVFAFDVRIELRSPIQDHDVRRYIAAAFDSVGELNNFVRFLRSSHCPDFADITSIELVLPLALGLSASPNRPNIGLLPGIALTVGSIGMLVSGFLLMKSHRHRSQVTDNRLVREQPEDRIDSFYDQCDYAAEIRLRDTFEVSTLSDPVYLGSFPPAASRAESSTIESLSVDYDYRRAFRDERSVSDVEESVAETRSNIFVPRDDDTLAAQYDSLIHLIAPPGALGLTLRFGNNGVPTVNDINAVSPLYNHVQAGDLLLSVDGEDVTAMLPAAVAKLIVKKKDQAVRRLVFSRQCLTSVLVDTDSFDLIDDIPPTR